MKTTAREVRKGLIRKQSTNEKMQRSESILSLRCSRSNLNFLRMELYSSKSTKRTKISHQTQVSLFRSRVGDLEIANPEIVKPRISSIQMRRLVPKKCSFSSHIDTLNNAKKLVGVKDSLCSLLDVEKRIVNTKKPRQEPHLDKHKIQQSLEYGYRLPKSLGLASKNERMKIMWEHSSLPQKEQRVVLGKLLGKGAFSSVFLGNIKGFKPETLFAIKVIRKSKIDSVEKRKMIERELSILSNIRYPTICSIHKMFEDQKRVLLKLTSDLFCNGLWRRNYVIPNMD